MTDAEKRELSKNKPGDNWKPKQKKSARPTKKSSESLRRKAAAALEKLLLDNTNSASTATISFRSTIHARLSSALTPSASSSSAAGAATVLSGPQATPLPLERSSTLPSRTPTRPIFSADHLTQLAVILPLLLTQLDTNLAHSTSLAIRLATNLANNNPRIYGQFTESSLIHPLVSAITATF
ncbi:hypothetical protein H2199_008982 [Coniosporium tulheliwenetii]|uniref:Uncharacterized protein n=1 Tax=Coniosporium tulheliwenetii TaxID=3383036 RepID=A0ACC2YH71_9PEZI|nr:hypothetical protein H2199_008982 [Cladosporium sp. JES 115]